MVCTSARVAVGVWGVWGGWGRWSSELEADSGGWVALGISREGSVGSIEGGSFFHRLFSSRFQEFSRDCWLGPSKCPEHILGQQMVSFLVFVEKVPADHINLNSTGPHLSGILLYKRSLIKDF